MEVARTGSSHGLSPLGTLWFRLEFGGRRRERPKAANPKKFERTLTKVLRGIRQTVVNFAEKCPDFYARISRLFSAFLVLVGLGIPALSQSAGPLSPADAAAAGRVSGLEFTEAECRQMLQSLNQRLATISELRARNLPNSAPSALVFDPRPPGFVLPRPGIGFHWEPPAGAKRPGRTDDLAFASVAELAAWLRSGQVTSVELTQLSLDRLRRYGPSLHCVVGLTEERGLKEARRADAELRDGRWRGPLHGIPYGAKDLLDVTSETATWGVSIRTNQPATRDASVIQKLEAAGAVLVARLSMGELAMGDTWFGGLTRNPWRPDTGSSGSSAGSASAVAAGLVPFAIGSETLGSIVSPATVCGVTGLRPTFGRVARTGAMSLCFSLDKLGPLARSAEDCALVLEVIRGGDGLDRSVVDAPFDFPSVRPMRELRVAWLKGDFEREYANRTNDLAALEVLRGLGIQLREVVLPKYPSGPFYFLLNAEAASAFDPLTRDHQDDQLVQQGDGNWPNIFRSARLVSAVDYLEANRLRAQLIKDFAELFLELDVLVAPTWMGRQLPLSNMTGNPCVVVPNGPAGLEAPASICFLGRLYGESEILALAHAYQQATRWNQSRPELSRLEHP